MGNKPSEYNGVNCGICGKSLPPCTDWDGFVLKTIDRTVDVVQAYEFLSGRYYRIMGRGTYYCPEDFWRPRTEYLQRQEEEKRRREEQERQRQEEERRRQEELARQREEARQRELQRQREEEEERRLQEQRRQEELQRQEEASREAVRKEALLEEEEATKQKFEDYRVNEDQLNKEVSGGTYKPVPESSSDLSDQVSYYETLLREDVDLSPQSEAVTEELLSSIIFSLELLTTEDKELDNAWLRSAQIVILSNYLQAHNFTKFDAQTLLDFLPYLQVDLSDKECLTLAKTMVHLQDVPPLDFTQTFGFVLDDTLPLLAKVSSLLLYSGQIYNERNLWMQRCLYTVISSQISDQQISQQFLDITNQYWTTYNWFELFQNFVSSSVSTDTQKQILHLVQTYCLRPSFVKTVVAGPASNIISSLTNQIESEENKVLSELITEIRDSGLLDNSFITKINEIATRVYNLLDNFNIDLDYDSRLQSSMSEMKRVFNSLKTKNASINYNDTASSILTLMCAVRKCNPWYPRRTQVVGLIILILTGVEQANKLLEMKTGEGKSCLVALYTAVLCMQDKKVDIVTSSPILAVRDVEEWAEFYRIFDFTVTHNTDLERDADANMDDVKKDCYQHNIVYGTVGNFCGDILREEFQQKEVRQGRPFDAVIVDEVDMLMLDEGVQFTYLSHNAAILNHMESVFGVVWGLIGPLRLTLTTGGKVLYAGTPKLFTEAIFECLDPEISNISDPAQILAIAKNEGIITDSQYQKLNDDEQETKKEGIAELTTDSQPQKKGTTTDSTKENTLDKNQQIVTDSKYQKLSKNEQEVTKEAIAEGTQIKALNLLLQLQNYENMPEFLAFVTNSENLLETATEVSNDDDAEKLLLLDGGLACPLNTYDEVVERATAILQSKLKFSDSTDDNAPVKLPLFLKEFVMNQVSVYVESAIRALHMEEDREYAISEGRIIPVDFQNSGVMEMNKKWGGGLQQMLEMKHNLGITPISLVTNFMSNVEYFTRYAEGGIYGMSGTLGLDPWSNTKAVLNQLYDTTVCSIPTFKARKLFEKPAIIVENKEKWYQQIISTVNQESANEASWKTGRAALILCEDIKSAEDLREYVIQNAGWAEDKVHLYAHSNSKQLTTIKTKLSRGEVIIATNLAGRGTNVKVVDAVNESGGLLCLVTFLARNRRVELQAFGRTARSGRPGSVRCILDASAMPSQYTGLDIQAIRKVRAEEESLRLNLLMNNDVKEVKLKEELFKNYCSFLSEIHSSFDGREDLTVVVDSTNENWGAWLETKRSQIEGLQKDDLLASLSTAKQQWRPAVPSSDSEIVRLPKTNFYHLVQFGNQLIISEGNDKLQRAVDYYTESIRLESRYGLIAYYNRAYCNITSESSGYKTSALNDIKAAVESVSNYMDELSLVNSCVNMVRQTRETKQRTDDGSGNEMDPRDFAAQIQARFDIYSFLKEKMDDAISEINKLDGANYIAKPVGIFSLIPDANYITNMELTALWTLGLEIVYTIEKKPEFNWGALAVFLLGVVQILGGVLLAVFTVGTAASIGMSLIAEGVSDCIAGIEGMVTGEFDWVEWGITKATGLALSLISGGISRLATTGFKAIKTTFKVATTVGKQLKAIPTVVKSSIGVAAKTNMKNAAKYVAKETVLQGINYAQNKAFDAAMSNIYTDIGKDLSSKLASQVQNEFANNQYFGDVVDQRYTRLLDPSFSSRSEVPEYMQSTAKKFFNRLNDATIAALSNDSDVKARLTSASLSLFEQISDSSSSSKKVSFIANIAEASITAAVVGVAVTNLQLVVDEYIPKMKEVCQRANTADKITALPSDGAAYRDYSCVITFKSDLAQFVIDKFADSIAALIQGKLSPMVSHVMNRTVGTVTRNVVDKYIVKTGDTLEQITAGQHANYIRAVGPSESSTVPVSKELVSAYANHVEDSSNAGSIMDLRIASEHFGQKVVIYQEKNGKLVKDSSIKPKETTTDDTIELLYTAPPDDSTVGHYDVIVEGSRIRVQADNSNCLFHAFALGRNPYLSASDLRVQADDMRKNVVQIIRDQPQMWGEHITLRIEMDNLRRGNRFALIGAGPQNPKTKVLKDFYEEQAVGNKVYTMYHQDNGIVAKAIKTYDKPLNVVNGIATATDARLQSIKVHMDNLSLDANKGKRCWATKPLFGMLKRYKGKAKDTEVSFHMVASRAGGNAGEKYSNAIMASPHYNNLEKYIWTKEVIDTIGKADFSMTVEGTCGRVDQNYNGNRNFTATERKRLKRRFEQVENVDERAYRMLETEFTIFFPPGTTQTQLDDIENASKLTCKTDFNTKSATFSLGPDDELFVPTDVTTLDSNGELHKNELSAAKSKVPKMEIGSEPIYRSKPTVAAAAYPALYNTFQNDWAYFLANGF